MNVCYSDHRTVHISTSSFKFDLFFNNKIESKVLQIHYIYRYLQNVSVEGDQGKPNIEFTQDGVLKAAELKIMNLRPGISKQLIWEEVSV